MVAVCSRNLGQTCKHAKEKTMEKWKSALNMPVEYSQYKILLKVVESTMYAVSILTSAVESQLCEFLGF